MVSYAGCDDVKMKVACERCTAYKANGIFDCAICFVSGYINENALTVFAYVKLGCSILCIQSTKKGDLFSLDKLETSYNEARENMSPVFECDSLDSFFKLIPRVGPDCFTAMSYPFEWQSLLTEMEGDSHPESLLRDVAGQNDRGHSKCYYTGLTQYLPKAPHCVFIHNLDCRLIGGSLR